MRYWTACGAVLCVLGCGGGTLTQSFGENRPTGSPPIIMRVDPANGQVGDVISIFGVGYSIVPAENVLHIGATSAAAEGYQILTPAAEGEVEALTVTVPDGVSSGEQALVLEVMGEPSNADITFTVLP